MKDFKRIIFVVAVLNVLWWGFLACSQYETHYDRFGKVVENNNNIITVEDTTGNFWEMDADMVNDKVTIGDSIRMVMNANHTDNYIYDDIIESVHLTL